MDQIWIARQMHRAFEMLIQHLELPDSSAMEIADLYEDYAVGKTYAPGEIFRYGVNAYGETQLYCVLQSHTAQSDWKPDCSPSLYRPVGITNDGLPVWTRPLGATDAYTVGDRVAHNGAVWISTIDANVWEPGVYGWEQEA